MNTKVTILLGALFLLFLSCDRVADKIAVGTEISLSVDAGDHLTKTWLGDGAADDGPVPVYWSDGDIINVNGRSSSPISIADGEMKSEAEFKVRGVEAPYSIVYPASVCGSNPYVEGKICVQLPAVQQYHPASFGNGAAVTCAYVSDTSEEIRMKNLCSLVKIGLKDDEGAVITKVFIRSEGEDCPIAGTFDLDPREASLTSVEGENEIELQLSAPIQLGSQVKDFYITLPAGEYPEGFSIFFVREDGRRMRCRWLRMSSVVVEGISLLPSSMVCFKDVEFVPGAKVIETEADWNSFATAVTEGKDLDVWLENGVAYIDEDITFGSAPTQITEFGYVLDGCGHKLVSTASSPLFGTLKGTVKNLILEGSLTASSGPQVAPFIGLLSGGTVENCTNRMTVTFEGASDVALSGLVAKADGGKITGCVNEGNITQKVDGTSVQFDVCCGGIVASAGGNLLVEKSENKGTVSTGFDGPKRPKNAGFGGIAGRITDGSSESHVKLSGCTNRAKVSLKYSDISKGGQQTAAVGGIVGSAALYENNLYLKDPTGSDYMGIYTVIEDCTNEGVVSNEAICASDSWIINDKTPTGGIAGCIVGASSTSWSLVKNCVSKGNVIPHTGTYSRGAYSSVCGGITGIAGYVSIEGCTVNATVGTTKKHTFSTGGIAGLCLTSFKFDGCKVFARIEMIRVKNFSDNNASLTTSLMSKINGKEPVPNPVLTGSAITGCGFGGSIKAVTVASGTTAVPASVATVNLAATDFENYVVGGNYTGKDVAISGNYYWNGN